MNWSDATFTNSDVIRFQFDYIATGDASLSSWVGVSDPSPGTITADGTQRSYDQEVTITDATNFEARFYPGTTGSWKIDNLIVTKTN